MSRLPARRAEGTLRFLLQGASGTDLTIPQGTVCLTAGGTAFATTQAAVLSAGSLWVDVPAQAVQPGPAGNVPTGVVRALSLAPVGVAACTNPTPFTGGREEEADEALRARILATYQSTANGTNSAYYAREALAVPGVAAVKVLPRNRGLGTVDVIIAAADGMPEQSLVNQVQEDLESKREIAVDVSVQAPEAVPVHLILSVQAQEGVMPDVVIQRVKDSMETWFDGSMLARNLLLVEIAQRIYQVEGVANYRIDGPVNDVLVEGSQLPVLGSLSVEEM